MQSTILERIPQTSSFILDNEENGARENNGSVKFHKWTRKEYYQMAELGFFQGKRVELIEGEIIEMSPMNKPHATAVRRLLSVLKNYFGEGFLIDSQLPMSFKRASEPEPDVAVVRGTIDDFTKSHPKTAELIVEVSDTTLRYDRTVKAELYARNGIPEYWILNLKERRLEIHRQPKKDKKRSAIYQEIKILSEDDRVAPLAAPDAKIKITDLLP